MDIAGKVFIVTGGASGLGEGTARMLAESAGAVECVACPSSTGDRGTADICGPVCVASSLRRPVRVSPSSPLVARLPVVMPRITYIADQKIADAGTFTLMKEDHTLGNIIRMSAAAAAAAAGADEERTSAARHTE